MIFMTSYRPHPHVISTTIDDNESVLLHLEAQQYYSLNETGSRIWELFSDGHDVNTIASAIAEEWAISETEALQHVLSFLQELSGAGLVKKMREDSTA